jgi:hypothetical protein
MFLVMGLIFPQIRRRKSTAKEAYKNMVTLLIIFALERRVFSDLFVVHVD